MSEGHEGRIRPCSAIGRAWAFIGGWQTRRGLYYDERDVRRPWLLRNLYLFSVLVVPVCLVGLIAAAFNNGSFQINGTAMTGHEFLMRGGLSWFLGFAVGGATIARALRPPATSARKLLMGIFGGLFVFAIASGARPDASQVFFAVIEVALFAWYLYLKPSSKSYFADDQSRI